MTQHSARSLGHVAKRGVAALVALALAFYMVPAFALADADAADEKVSVNVEIGHDCIAGAFEHSDIKSAEADNTPVDPNATMNGTVFTFSVPKDWTCGDVCERVSRVFDKLGCDREHPFVDEKSGDKLFGFVTLKPLTEYASQDELYEEVASTDKSEELYAEPVTAGQMFYLGWFKPVKSTAITVAAPVCGTDVHIDEDSLKPSEDDAAPTPVLVGGPTVTVPDSVDAVGPDGMPPHWALSLPEEGQDIAPMFFDTIVGGTTYAACVPVVAKPGYYWPDDWAQNVLVNGEKAACVNDLDSKMNMPGSTCMLVYANIEAEHVWGEGTANPKATCTEDGTLVTPCKFNGQDWHGADATKTAKIPATGHKWGAWKVTVEPTAAKPGKKVRACENDPSHTQEAEVPATGKGKRTADTAKFSLKGDTGLKLSWTKVKGADGYEVFFSPCTYKGKETKCKKVKTLKSARKTTWTKKGLKKGRAYKAYVRAYTVKDGAKTYLTRTPTVHAFAGGADDTYTNAKKVKVAKKNLSVGVGKSAQVKATAKKLVAGKKLIAKNHAPKLRYLSTDTEIATVDKKGKVTGAAKGTCRVFVLAANGVGAYVNITVK